MPSPLMWRLSAAFRTALIAMPVLINVAGFMTRMIMVLAWNFPFFRVLLVAMTMRIEVSGLVAWMIVMTTGLFLGHSGPPLGWVAGIRTAQQMVERGAPRRGMETTFVHVSSQTCVARERGASRDLRRSSSAAPTVVIKCGERAEPAASDGFNKPRGYYPAERGGSSRISRTPIIPALFIPSARDRHFVIVARFGSRSGSARLRLLMTSHTFSSLEQTCQ